MPRLRAFAALLLLALSAAALPASAAAETGVYHWKMRRGEAGESALAALRDEPDAPRPRLLFAELRRDGAEFRAHHTDALASPALAQLGRPLTLVIRAGAHGGDFHTDTRWRALLAATTRRALADATAAKLPVEAVQLDFDSPVARLAGYAAVLSSLRAELPAGVALTVTGMPAWLDSTALPELLRTVDAWTLQVHLTHLPKSIDAIPPLCDVARAAAWARRAEALGHPFRIALPTYAYRAHFDADGRFLAVESETARVPAGSARTVVWQPDFTALSGFVRELAAQPPRHFLGIDWYRLPAEDDRLNLTRAAFATLRRGEAPAPGRAEVRLVRDADAPILDVRLHNSGALDLEIPRELIARFPAGRPLAYDLPGSRRIQETDTTLRFAPPGGSLRPGESVALGWFRFPGAEHPLAITVSQP